MGKRGGEGREKRSSLREFALLTSRHPEHWRVRKRLGSGPGGTAAPGHGDCTAGSRSTPDDWVCKVAPFFALRLVYARRLGAQSRLFVDPLHHQRDLVQAQTAPKPLPRPPRGRDVSGV